MITIKVESDHIDGGSTSCSFRCPVALAFKDQVRLKSEKYRWAISSRKVIIINKYGTFLEEYHLPPVASQFIIDFDNNEDVKPFSFEMDFSYPTESGGTSKIEVRSTT